MISAALMFRCFNRAAARSAAIPLAMPPKSSCTAGLLLLTEALELDGAMGGGWWKAELYRLQGELLLNVECGVRSVEWTPEACFLKALEVARRKQAKSWELRAATSLARLWQFQGKRQEAYELLAPIYNWFTEGLDTADLQDARELLETLGQPA